MLLAANCRLLMLGIDLNPRVIITDDLTFNAMMA